MRAWPIISTRARRPRSPLPVPTTPPRPEESATATSIARRSHVGAAAGGLPTESLLDAMQPEPEPTLHNV